MALRLVELEAERDAAVASKKKLQEAYQRLLEQYALLKRRMFAAKAERVDYSQLELEFHEVKQRLEEDRQSVV